MARGLPAACPTDAGDRVKRPGPLRRRRKRRDPARPLEWLPYSPGWWADRVDQHPEPIILSSTQSNEDWRFDKVVRHHVIPQQTLRNHADVRRVKPWILVWDPRVGIKVSKRRHERHHSGHEPIRRDELPARVFEFAEEMGLGWYLDRHYPKETR